MYQSTNLSKGLVADDIEAHNHSLLPHDLNTITYTCEICFELLDANDPHNPVKMLKCRHSFCSECFKAYYESLIQDEGQSNSLKCPQAGCGLEPTLADIQQIISQDCFNKFKRY